MEYPELVINGLTPDHVDTYLSSLERTLESISELAEAWSEMEEAEQFHFRLEFTQAFGLRRLLGTLYQSNRLSSDQTRRLANLDRQLLADAHRSPAGLDYGWNEKSHS